MSCERLVVDGKVVGFVCSRGRRKAAPKCKCGRRSTKLCDYPLRGKKAGQTCDRKLCDGCAKTVGPDRDYCPAHVRVDAQRALL